MAYERIDWLNDKTALSAENLNKMDEALANMSEHGDNLEQIVNDHTEAIKDLTDSMIETNEILEDHERRITINDEICKRLENEAADNFDHVDINGNTLTFWANGIVVEKLDFLIKTEDDVLIFPGKDGREIELKRNGNAIQWHYVDEVQWKTLVMIDELKGEKGDMPNITIGTITTVEWDEGAYVENIGTSENVILNFHIPRGKPGKDAEGGEGGGEVKEGYTFIPSVSPEGIISWTNNGELENPTPVNIRGPKGEPGRDGRDGVSGSSGEDGKAATIKIGTVNTVDMLQGASVENVGTASAAIFNFKIPRGPEGPMGPKGNDAEIPENVATTDNITWAIIKDKPAQVSDRLSFIIKNSTIILTNNYYQYLDVIENVTFKLPVNKAKNVVMEMHVFLNIGSNTNEIKFTDEIRWANELVVEPNTTIELILKNINLKWIGESKVYK